jgi:hypothetical protein
MEMLRDKSQERGFSTTRWSQDNQQLPFCNAEAGIVDGNEFSVALVDGSNLDLHFNSGT